MTNNYGFDAVPVNPEDIFGPGEKNAVQPKPVTYEELVWEETALVKKARAFVENELNPPTFNHSERVFYIGRAVAQQHFPAHQIDLESYYLACLFHDIGCSEHNIRATKMSFEYYGGILAREWLLKKGAKQELADSVCETIFRHTDFVSGNITLHGQIIQLATIIDNLGDHSHLIHDKSYADIVKHYDREGWSTCFADTMQAELDLKPWSHTTSLLKNDFVNAARGNPYGVRFEKGSGVQPK